MTFLNVLVPVLFILLAGLFFALAPGYIRPAATAAFRGRNFAHRGLHARDASVPENSLMAFRDAVAAGYGVELDVQLSHDGQVMVFHDDTLDRVCDVPGRLDAQDAGVLRTLPLCCTGEKIPFLSDALAVLGDAPVIVELKSGPNNDELCEKTYAILKEKGRIYCVESFDPRIVAWFRRHAPEVVRGQLAMHPQNYEGQKPIVAFLLGNLLTNCIARPHFIAYDAGPMTGLAQVCRMLGPMMVVWTLRPGDKIAAYERTNDAVIFEFYRPNPYCHHHSYRIPRLLP